MRGLVNMLMPRVLTFAEEGEAGKGPVTQEAIDKVFAISKRNQESLEKVVAKLDKSEAEKVAILAKVKELESRTEKPVIPEGDEEKRPSEIYNENNFPRTQEEWDELYEDSPSAAMELHSKFREAGKKHLDTHNEAVRKLMEKHPDMYKKNDRGEFEFDANSEKGKVWIEVAKNTGKGTNPLIVMEAMENRLKGQKEEQVKKEVEEKKKKEEEDRKKKVEDGQVASGGGEPSPKEEDIKIEYVSEEEKKHVARAIARGTFKDEKDYFRIKKMGTEIPYGRGGF